MNYRNMIEPYLYGNLSPEDEVAFERQLSRDPALVDETSRRLNAGEVLARIPEYRDVSRRSSSVKGLLLAGLAAVLLGLYWWKTRPSEASADNQQPPVATPVIESEVLSR